jgi:ribosomal peptide maturation radical SAM protein 1
MDMDALPYPEFEGYFADLRASRLAGIFDAHLVFETSRGCWWGAKHHCTFCGLNGDTMAFRSKAADRAFAEIKHLTEKYAAKKLGCVDNILDMRYIDTLFPRLAEANYQLDIFYEVKANLRFAQLEKMRCAGVTQIQPGIETFSDQVLKLMDKGCTGLQNIQLLRWCEELGIGVAWNILAGFPDEDANEYQKMAALVPLLTHLAPPCSCGLVRLDRFSPFHTRADKFGFKKMRPARAYYYVFPFDRQEISRIAYYFDFDYGDGRDPQAYLSPIQREVQHWIAARAQEGLARPRLDAHFEDGRVTIEDTRMAACAPRHEVSGPAADILLRCDTIATPESLARDAGVPVAMVRDILGDLTERGLIIESGGKYLTLAVFRNRAEAAARVTTTESSILVSQTAHS